METELVACPICLGDGIDKYKHPCWACDGTGEFEIDDYHGFDEDDDDPMDEIDF